MEVSFRDLVSPFNGKAFRDNRRVGLFGVSGGVTLVTCLFFPTLFPRTTSATRCQHNNQLARHLEYPTPLDALPPNDNRPPNLPDLVPHFRGTCARRRRPAAILGLDHTGYSGRVHGMFAKMKRARNFLFEVQRLWMGGSLWIRLGRAGKRTDLIAHIDSFLCFFSTPVTLFVSWMISSPRGGGPSAPRQRPFLFFFHPCSHCCIQPGWSGGVFFPIQATKGAGLDPGSTTIPPGV